MTLVNKARIAASLGAAFELKDHADNPAPLLSSTMARSSERHWLSLDTTLAEAEPGINFGIGCKE